MPFTPVPNGTQWHPSPKHRVRAPPFSPFRYVFMSGQLHDARLPGAVLG